MTQSTTRTLSATFGTQTKQCRPALTPHPSPNPSPTMGGESGGTLPAPVGEGLGAGSETSQLLRSTFGRSCYGKNSVKIIINPESLTGLRDLFCALLYAIILTSCSFSDK